MRGSTATGVMVLLAVGLCAQASDPNRARCASDKPDTRIDGCTALIVDGRETPDNVAAAYFNRGLAFHAKGNDARATRDFTSAIANRPKFPAAFDARAGVYLAEGRFADAVHDYSQAITFAPSDAHAHFGRGVAFFDTADYERARQDFDATLKLDPTHSGAPRYRELTVDWEVCAGSAPDARLDGCAGVLVTAPFVDGAWLDANLTNLLNTRGLAHLALGQYDLALADFDAAGERQPDAAAPFNNRARVYFEKQDVTHALAEFGEAIQRAPRDPTPLANRGLAYLAAKNTAAASADFEGALGLDRKFGLAWSGRAIVDVGRGRYDDAIAEFNTAIGIDPRDVRSLYGRGVARTRRGDVAGGAADVALAKQLQPDIVERSARLGL